MTPPWFTTEQVDAAIDHVINHGAIDRGRSIRYTAVFVAAGLPEPQDLHAGGDGTHVTAFMKAFHDRCLERDLPPLDSLVVHVAGAREGHPGHGYFVVNGQPDPFSERTNAAQVMRGIQFLERQQAEVKAWGILHRRGTV